MRAPTYRFRYRIAPQGPRTRLLAKHSPFSAGREVPFHHAGAGSGLAPRSALRPRYVTSAVQRSRHRVSRARRNGSAAVSPLDNHGPLHQHMQVHLQRAIPRASAQTADVTGLRGRGGRASRTIFFIRANTAETPNVPMAHEDRNFGYSGHHAACRPPMKEIGEFDSGYR